MQKAMYSVQINRSKKDMWHMLSDLENAKYYVPGVKHISFEGNQKMGEGTVRKIHPAQLEETVIDWQEEKTFTMRLSKKGKDAFFPFKTAFFSYTISEEMPGILVSLTYEPMIPGVFLKHIIQKKVKTIAQNLKIFYEESV